MKKLKLVFVGMFILVIFLTSITASAETNYRYLYPLRDAVYDDVQPYEYVVLRYGWAAMTRGLVKSYIRRVETSFELTGEGYSLSVGPEKAKLSWGPVYPRDSSPEWPCPTTKSFSGAYWKYPIGTLEPGEYVLQFDNIIKPPVIDGCDFDGDGRPDKYYGEESILTITVLEPQ